MPSFRSVVLSAAAASVAMAQTKHIVKVGQEGNSFDPVLTTAAEGDVVEFHFWPANHSVVSGSLEDGCAPSGSSGFFSGFMPVAEGMGESVFQVTIESEDPIVFYCSQARHCQAGMFGMINGDADAQAAYETLASGASANQNPEDATAAFGGVVAAMEEDDTTEDGDDTSSSSVMAASMGMSVAAFVAAVMLS